MLLDNFVTETARSEREEELEIEEAHKKIQVNHALDPLLTRFVQTYVNDADMSIKLRKLFLFIKGPQWGDISAKQFAKGLRSLNVNVEGKNNRDFKFFYEQRQENPRAYKQTFKCSER